MTPPVLKHRYYILHHIARLQAQEEDRVKGELHMTNGPG